MFKTRTRKTLFSLSVVIGLLFFTSPAFAAGELPVEDSNILLYTLLIGGLVPLVGYVINFVGPWVSEPVKALVQALTAAVAAALYQALEIGNLGFNDDTLSLVLAAIVATFTAHKLIWRPSGVSVRLGGGRNKAEEA